jgi:uncharacterized protein DUF4386
MTSSRNTALAVGVLFLITFVTSIGAALLYGPLIDNPGTFIRGAGSDSGVLIGVVLELILIVANMGTALVLYPLLRRQNEVLAFGYVVARTFECVFIAIGIFAVLSTVTLRQQVVAGADPGSLLALGQSFVALNRWAFVLGPGFVVGIGNGLILGWLMYRSGLLPRGVALLGLVGGPLIFITGAAIVLGIIPRGGAVQGIATIPEFLWEGAILGIWLIVKGFNSSRAAALERREQPNAAAYAAA